MYRLQIYGVIEKIAKDRKDAFGVHVGFQQGAGMVGGGEGLFNAFAAESRGNLTQLLLCFRGQACAQGNVFREEEQVAQAVFQVQAEVFLFFPSKLPQAFSGLQQGNQVAVGGVSQQGQCRFLPFGGIFVALGGRRNGADIDAQATGDDG